MAEFTVYHRWASLLHTCSWSSLWYW